MIECTTNGMRYVGGTTLSFAHRFNSHRSALKSGIAPRLLQAAYDLYGLDALRFTELEELPPDKVSARESEVIAELQPELNIHGPSERARFRLASNGSTFTTLFRGKTMTLAQISQETGLSAQMLRARIKRGFRDEELVAPPHRLRRKNRPRWTPEDYV